MHPKQVTGIGEIQLLISCMYTWIYTNQVTTLHLNQFPDYLSNLSSLSNPFLEVHLNSFDKMIVAVRTFTIVKHCLIVLSTCYISLNY